MAALLSTSTVKQAAKESGISESTIRRRLKDPELSYLMTDEGKEIVKIMQKLPQVFFVSMKDLQQAIKEE